MHTAISRIRDFEGKCATGERQHKAWIKVRIGSGQRMPRTALHGGVPTKLGNSMGKCWYPPFMEYLGLCKGCNRGLVERVGYVSHHFFIGL